MSTIGLLRKSDPVKKYNVLGDFRDSVLVLPLFSPIVDIIVDKRLEIFRLLFVGDLWKMGTMGVGGIKLFFIVYIEILRQYFDLCFFMEFWNNCF